MKKKQRSTASVNVSQREVERMFGFEIVDFYYQQKHVDEFITEKAPQSLKKEIFEQLVCCLYSQGFPGASLSSSYKTIVTDYVGTILQMIQLLTSIVQRKDN